jgi:hypothetical protein
MPKGKGFNTFSPRTLVGSRGRSLGSLSGSVFGDDTLGTKAQVPDVPSVASVTPPSSSSSPSLFDKIGEGIASFFNTAAKAGTTSPYQNTGIVPPGFPGATQVPMAQPGMSPITKIALLGGAAALVYYLVKRR